MSNRTRRQRKKEGRRNRQNVVRRKKVQAKHRTRGDTKVLSDGQSRYWTGGGIQNVIQLLDQHQRLMSLGHVVANAFVGALVGLILALLVIHFTGKFSTPWTFILNLGSVLLLKVILQWGWTIWVNPFVEKQAGIFVSDRTGQELPDGRGNVSQGDDKLVQSLITSCVAAVGMATVLVTTEDLKPAWLLESFGIVIASASLAALTLAAEAMSTKTTIVALWKNRHQYQETLGYQDSAYGNGRTRRGRR